MRDHALIGIWPMEKALRSWIKKKWNPKGHITLHLGPKGFFTAVFNCLEDQNRILDGGPYFFNSAGLYLKAWVERFNLDKEDLSYAPVWIRLYSLPWEYWEESSLQEIGNALGEFIKVAEDTKFCRYTSYARICVYMDLKQALPDTVSILHEDVEWIQLIDYEHVSFRCRKCHNLGHLFGDCPLNKKCPLALMQITRNLMDLQKLSTVEEVTKNPIPIVKQIRLTKPNPQNLIALRP